MLIDQWLPRKWVVLLHQVIVSLRLITLLEEVVIVMPTAKA